MTDRNTKFIEICILQAFYKFLTDNVLRSNHIKNIIILFLYTLI